MIDAKQIEDVKWYSGGFPGCIGIVLVNTGFGYKSYIAPAGGYDEDVDKWYIAQNGAKFYDGRALWPNITEWAS